MLLERLSAHDASVLAPAMETVGLALRQPIEQANEQITHAYFPLSGIISIVARSGDEQVEAGIVGREGMTGTAIVLGNHRSPNDAFVQGAGAAVRVDADALRAALEASASLRQLMQRFAHVFMMQVTQTALANARGTLSERLARWLLMAHDRHDNDELQLTHEFVAIMLAVRRPGVTTALHELEGKHLIRSSRGAIRVIDRKGLEQHAGATYGVAEAEYKRLIG
jgi:CRP-like cAMP-binding protein